MRSLRIERDPLEPILEHLTGLRKRVPGRDTEGPISRGQAPLVRGSSNFQGPSSKESQTAALGKSGALIKRGVHRLDMVHGFHPWLHAFAPPGLETSDASSHPIHPGPNSRLFLFVPFDPFVVRKTHQPFRAFRVIRGPLNSRGKTQDFKTQDTRPEAAARKGEGQRTKFKNNREKTQDFKTQDRKNSRAPRGAWVTFRPGRGCEEWERDAPPTVCGGTPQPRFQLRASPITDHRPLLTIGSSFSSFSMISLFQNHHPLPTPRPRQVV